MIQKLPVRFVEKVWGVERLPSPFPHPSEQSIGEVWFEPPPELDQLLVKYIFASERLSVQAHPDDHQARAMELGDSGKSECWVILDAEPGATIAVGFREETSAEELRASAIDGTIVDKLVWHEVFSGDAFYIPAGTVHAIGGGVSLIEVQQNSDITFRLFDYGRPRELHLDRGIEVSSGSPYPAEHRGKMDGDSGLLVDGPHFRLAYWRCGSEAPLPSFDRGPLLLIPFSGELFAEGVALGEGECAYASSLDMKALSGDCLLLLAQHSSSS
ncbi:class I mannose-6-phosphate isomerase [Qipengyuania qiaonensis]|uniref:Class I mannose-6-phosphate isomerase n=1 Tax=Qipengyuania qiaonensis TaxID=2867240 RepID=A0ABS7J0X8_9SPHN|nr:class I mannose-6-phosphate isomerase [Qipengyuania qiaonensis]MBX7480981.1 class I mannose-6-phosphate isomerase [Qipengyuania qiaonensis]